MGLGRAIAVLTSGGDAQGKHRMSSNISWQPSEHKSESEEVKALTASLMVSADVSECNTDSQPAVKALACILQGPVKYHVNALTSAQELMNRKEFSKM